MDVHTETTISAYLDHVTAEIIVSHDGSDELPICLRVKDFDRWLSEEDVKRLVKGLNKASAIRKNL